MRGQMVNRVALMRQLLSCHALAVAVASASPLLLFSDRHRAGEDERRQAGRGRRQEEALAQNR